MDGILRNFSKLLSVQSPIHQFNRTLIILKRRHPVQLQKKNSKHKPILKGRHFVYDIVENPERMKREKIDVILTQYVEGLGHQGELVSVRPTYAYDQLLLPKFAIYASPDNLERMKNNLYQTKDEEKPSSIHALQTAKYLKKMVVSVSMNKDEPWTIEPWHIRVSLRKMNVHVLSDDSIELPEHPISGPDFTLEGKSFVVYITINKKEKVPVECNLHHWSTKLADRLPRTKFFTRTPISILPEQTELLMSMRGNINNN
ncbi:large ribosomal subunit protein bL9m [Metopolophium dirhodum]|uniref:large ribosomal subunit protein bL9m n=1 Tax=Metopolophium dirhodum TaxID=44670 RepID=UPI00298F6A41|nr:large ribosomal subunit protein bL9m [Metopolophium dirhodum]